jgi:hypothetical protein
MNPIPPIYRNEVLAGFACCHPSMLTMLRQQTSRASKCMRNSGGVFLPTIRIVTEAPLVNFGREPATSFEPIGLPADWQNHPLWKS